MRKTTLIFKTKVAKNKDNKDKLSDGEGMSNILYFSGMGFQMIAVIGVFAYAGHLIDEYRGSVKPIFTAVFCIIGVVISLYSVIKSIIKK